jgi:hypothetical protein
MSTSTSTQLSSTDKNCVKIEGIFTCSVGSEDMISKDMATLIVGVGLEGDRYANNVGTYSVLQEPGRQLTLISADGVEAALKERQLNNNHLDSIGKLRRNIVLRGISASNLLQAIGSVVEFGGGSGSNPSLSPQVFIHRNCVPW